MDEQNANTNTGESGTANTNTPAAQSENTNIEQAQTSNASQGNGTTDKTAETNADGKGGTIAGGAGGEEKIPATNDVPESYDFSKSVPEGMEFSEEAGTAFGSIAKEMKLSQDQAGKLANYGMTYAKGMMEAMQAKQAEQAASWGKETKEALGADYEKTVGYVGEAVEKLETKIPNIRQVLNESGFGNRKEIVMALAEMGRAFSEDTGHGTTENSTQTAHSKTWYPNSQD